MKVAARETGTGLSIYLILKYLIGAAFTLVKAALWLFRFLAGLLLAVLRRDPYEDADIAHYDSLVRREIELSMEEELRKLREATECKICMDAKVEVVFLPCGHLVACTRCARALSNCVVCRQRIESSVKTYLS